MISQYTVHLVALVTPVRLGRRRFVIGNMNILDGDSANPFEDVRRHGRLSGHHEADRLSNRFAPGNKFPAVLSALRAVQGLPAVLL